MATLIAMFDLLEGYSTTADLINKKARQVSEKILKASRDIDKINKKLSATGASSESDEINKGLRATGVDNNPNKPETTGASNDPDKLNDKLKATGAGANTAKVELGKFISITDIVKGAIKGFSMLDEFINTGVELNLIDKESADVWNRIKDGGIQAFTGVMGKVNDIIKSDRFNNMVNGIIGGFAVIASGVANVIDLVAKVGAFFSDNWSIIAPIISGITAALIAYNAAIIVSNTILAVKATLEGIAVASAALHAGSTLFEAAAATTATGAQAGLNAALLACPITWIIMGIIALVAIFYAAIGAINKFAGTSLSATGLIMGAFFTVGAFIWNLVVGVVNAIIQYLWAKFVEPFIGIIEWVLNVVNGGFDNFGGAVANLIGQMISWFLSFGKIVTKIIDAIFGTNWTEGLNSLQKSVLSWGKNDKAITISREAPELKDIGVSRWDYSDAANAGYSFGEKIDNKFKSFTDSLTGERSNEPITVKGEGNDGKVDVSMAEEDLRYLRDIAERDYINKFSTSTLAPNVQITFGDVHEEADANKVAGRIKMILQEEIATVSEGVY